jgi:hypothetical protein
MGSPCLSIHPFCVQNLFARIQVVVMQHGIQHQRIRSMRLVSPHRVDAEDNNMAITQFTIHHCWSAGKLAATG